MILLLSIIDRQLIEPECDVTGLSASWSPDPAHLFVSEKKYKKKTNTEYIFFTAKKNATDFFYRFGQIFQKQLAFSNLKMDLGY